MCKQHKLPTPKIDENGLPPLKLTTIPPQRVPPLPYQLDHVTPDGHCDMQVMNGDCMDIDSHTRKSTESEKELIRIRELQEILSDPSNYTQIVAGPETKAGMSRELAEMVKENEIILERIDQQLLELGPFAKDTFLSPPSVPKDEPFPITFMPPNYLPFPPPAGMEIPPLGAGPHGRNRRRGGRASMHQPPPLMNNKTKRNSRGSETGSASSPMAPTPVELRMELGGEGVRERDTASPAMAAGVKEPPKSKWRKVGSAGTATKPPLQSRSSSDRLSSNLQSPVLDGVSVLSPSMSLSPVVALPVSVSPPTSSSKAHHGSSTNPASIIQPASDMEMQSLFSTNAAQWDLIESLPQQQRERDRERDLSSTSNTHSHPSHHHQQHHHIAGVHHSRASSERGDSPLTQNISLNSENGTIDRHHHREHVPSRSSRGESRGSPGMPSHGAPDPIPRPLSRPHSHSSSPPNSHHPPPPPSHHHHHHPHQTTPPSHSDAHAPSLSSTTSGSELSRYLVVSGGMPMVSRPNFSISHLTSARESHNSSPLVTSATIVNEERRHANSASPLSEHSSRSWVQRSSASPSLGSGVGDGENPLVDRSRRRNSSTSSHRSGRLHSFDEGLAHSQQRSSPHATKPPPPSQSMMMSSQLPAHSGQYSFDPKQPSSSGGGGGGGGEMKLGAPMNPYALWGATGGQFPPPAAGVPAPGQVVDPASVSSTTVPRFPFAPAAAPFLPGTNWIQTPGGMIAAAAPGLPPMRPAMLPFDPNSPYNTSFIGAPFLAQYRYSLPSAQALKAFPGLAGVSTGGNPATSSHPGTPTATIAIPFSQPGLYPALQSSSTLSAFKSLNDASVSNRLSPPVLHPQQLLGAGSKDDKQPQPPSAGSGGELPQPVSMDKLPGLNMMQPPVGSAAAALMAAGISMPYLGMQQMPFSIGGIPPSTIGQQTPGGGVSLFNPRLSTLASTGMHTGSEGNLTALGGASKETHRTHQRRGSAASIDVTGLSGHIHNESPPNQAKKGFPLGRSDPTAVPGGGKWKPVADHSPPVSQMLFNMSASPSSSPFAPAMLDSRTLPNSSHLMTSSLSQMLPLSFGTPPTHQQMRGGGKGAVPDGHGRGSPRGTPDKIKLRIHQVKNDDFKMQGKPDRRRRRWKNKGQEVISLVSEAVAPSPPPSGKQTASQLRRVRSDTARKASSTPPAVSAPDDKDEVVDVGDSSDNNYALNMLATMSTMQSREQNPSNDATSTAKTISASPLTISTSLSSSEPSKNPLMHSPVSLAGAKSLLMLGHMKESAKSDVLSSDRTSEEVTNVESTAVDSLLQLSGAVLQDTSKPLSSDNQGESSGDRPREEEVQRRETRSASYSAAEAMLMMGSTSSKEPVGDDNNTNVSTATNRQPSPQEVFSNGSGQEKQPSTSGEKLEEFMPPKPSGLSKTPRSLTIDSEATDTDSEATLTPQSPAKRLSSFSASSVEGRIEQEAASSAGSNSGMDLKQTAGEPSPPSATIPDAIERPREDSPLNSVPESSIAKTQIEDQKSTVEDSGLSNIHQPVTLTSSKSQSISVLEDTNPQTTASSVPDVSTASTVNDNLPDISNNHDIDEDLPPSKRLKLTAEQREDEESTTQAEAEATWQQSVGEASPNSQPEVTDKHDVSELSLKQTTDAAEETYTRGISPVTQEASSPPDNDQLPVKMQENEVLDRVESDSLSAQAEGEGMDSGRSPEQPSDRHEAEVDESKEDTVAEPAKSSPTSTDKVTSWSAFADVAQASYEDKDKDSVVEKAGDSGIEANEETTSSPPPPPIEEVNNKTVEKLKIDISAKRSSVSSISSPPFTPDPPIEIDVFEKLPPTPKMASRPLESETVLKETHATNHSDSLSLIPDKDKDQVQQSNTVASTSSNSSSVTSVSVSGGPQNRLLVSRPSPNRLQHRKHMSHSSKLGKDRKTDSRKRMRTSTDSQMRLFEVDTVSTAIATPTTGAATPFVHTHTHPLPHSSTKEKKLNSERASREDSHQQDDRHSPSVRKLKKLGHSSSKSSLGGQKLSKHNTASKYCKLENFRC